MTAFLAGVACLCVAVFAIAFGAGWLGRFLPGGWVWLTFCTLTAWLLPALSLWSYGHEAALSAARFPERAGIVQSFQMKTALLFLIALSLSLWGILRRWHGLALLPLGVFFIFSKLVLPPLLLADDQHLDEFLLMQLDGAANRGFFVACALTSAALLGLSLAPATAPRPAKLTA